MAPAGLARPSHPIALPMKLSARIDEAELRSIAHALVPLRLDLRENQDERARWIEINEIREARFVDGFFTLTVPVEVRWPERDMLTSFRVEHFELTLRPRMQAAATGAAFIVELRCSGIDLRWIPDFVDEFVARKIDERLRKAGVDFRWELTETLSFSLEETSDRSNIRAIGFNVPTATLGTDDGALELEGPMRITVDRGSVESFEAGVLEAKDEPRALPATHQNPETQAATEQ